MFLHLPLPVTTTLAVYPNLSGEDKAEAWGGDNKGLSRSAVSLRVGLT